MEQETCDIGIGSFNKKQSKQILTQSKASIQFQNTSFLFNLHPISP